MDSQVIVVGGGPVGLSLALGLAHHGVRSIVLEPRREPLQESRALVIWPRTIELLRDWNAWEQVRAAGTFSKTFTLHNAATDAPLLAIEFDAIADVFDDPGFLLIPQYTTEAVLRECVQASPYCELRLGVTATAVEQDADGVTVRARDESGGEHALRAPFAVGCDGAHSVVRGALDLTLEGITYSGRVVLTDEELDAPLPSPRIALDAPKLLFAARYAPGRWRVIAMVSKDLDDEAAVGEEEHALRLRALFGEHAARTHTVWRSLFRVHRRHVSRFAVGRVLFAGDAAHLNSPAGGQGMNAGIQDAANLAWKIAAIFVGGDERTLIESYDAERREMIEDSVERFTDRLTRWGAGFSRRLRRLGIGLLSRSVRAHGLQCKLGRALGMLNGRYTASPLIDAAHPVAGRRVSDLLLPDGRRVNAVRAGGAAVIAVGGADVGDLDAIHLPSPPKRWHVKPPVALIVRPDGCVAAVVEKPTAERVAAAWQRAFAGGIPLPAPGSPTPRT